MGAGLLGLIEWLVWLAAFGCWNGHGLLYVKKRSNGLILFIVLHLSVTGDSSREEWCGNMVWVAQRVEYISLLVHFRLYCFSYGIVQPSVPHLDV